MGLPSAEVSLQRYIVIKLLGDRAGEIAQKPNALATLPEESVSGKLMLFSGF